jgi:5'-methylthioadenosine phosphorylase
MTDSTTGAVADVAVIGGSGFYSFLQDPVEHVVQTPYGVPSAPVTVGEVAGRRVAFLPRHGTQHEHPPHGIPYRANLWALASLGVRQVLAPSAVGGLRDEVAPRDLVVPDQIIDRTHRRVASFVEQGATHVPFADPYCPRLAVALAARDEVKAGGTLVVIEGPRFSTRAESQSYAAQGWTLIGMTAAPEAMLARELRLCYQTIALVTDMDAGAASGEEVGQAEVFAVFKENLERVKTVLVDTIADLPDPAGCSCAAWAEGIDLVYDVPRASR